MQNKKKTYEAKKNTATTKKNSNNNCEKMKEGKIKVGMKENKKEKRNVICR